MCHHVCFVWFTIPFKITDLHTRFAHNNGFVHVPLCRTVVGIEHDTIYTARHKYTPVFYNSQLVVCTRHTQITRAFTKDMFFREQEIFYGQHFATH